LDRRPLWGHRRVVETADALVRDEPKADTPALLLAGRTSPPGRRTSSFAKGVADVLAPFAWSKG